MEQKKRGPVLVISLLYPEINLTFKDLCIWWSIVISIHISCVVQGEGSMIPGTAG